MTASVASTILTSREEHNSEQTTDDRHAVGIIAVIWSLLQQPAAPDRPNLFSSAPTHDRNCRHWECWHLPLEARGRTRVRICGQYQVSPPLQLYRRKSSACNFCTALYNFFEIDVLETIHLDPLPQQWFTPEAIIIDIPSGSWTNGCCRRGPSGSILSRDTRQKTPDGQRSTPILTLLTARKWP